MIVGRDTSQLDEHGITRAAVETVAEIHQMVLLRHCLYDVFGAVGASYIRQLILWIQ